MPSLVYPKQAVFVAALVSASCVTETTSSVSASEGDATSMSYEVVADWPQLPEGVSFGHVTAVAIDSAGLVYVAHTADGAARNERPIASPTIFVFEPASGELIRELGAGLFRMPQGLAIAPEDRLWVTGSDANLVFEFDRDGQVVRTLGQLG